MDINQQVLRIDVTGLPLEWVDYKGAASLYAVDQVIYDLGADIYTLFGGINSITGKRSQLTVNSIIATNGQSKHFQQKLSRYTPPLNNQTLFKRDAHLCLYCGHHFIRKDLTRDHIKPLSRGGLDTWQNVVTACKRCNHHKGGKTPEEAGIELLAIPFVPNYAEYIYLKGRNILADQMDFLMGYISDASPIHRRMHLQK
ncbi:MAG TPA: HNH endonuclease, partial [Gammaproteobacteria bacterium]|nr:HNH endonuclease [Gammaproteobacteria bacterium]